MLRIRATPKTRSEATHAPNTTQVPDYLYSIRSTYSKHKMGGNSRSKII